MKHPENILFREADGRICGVTSVTDDEGSEIRPRSEGETVEAGTCFHMESTGPARIDPEMPATLEFPVTGKRWQVFVEACAPHAHADFFRSRLRYSAEFSL